MFDSRFGNGAFIHPTVMISEGWRLLLAGMHRKFFGYRRHQGTAKEICQRIVNQCFDPEKKFFRTSTTSYSEFWARDFGRCVPALLSLGLENQVGDTYRYALGHYVENNYFSLVITPSGRLFDFPAYAPDGFALFIFGLEKLGDKSLINRHRAFLEREIQRFAKLVIDQHTGLVRRGVYFSEAQDYAIRDCSCYTNSFCHLLKISLASLNLPNPLENYDYRELLRSHFWDKDHFLDDQTRNQYPSGDAQILPFWSGAFPADVEGKAYLETVLQWMDVQGLNSPLPSRYGTAENKKRRMHFLHKLNPWQHDTVWTCLGLHFLEVLRDFRHPRFMLELERYRELVERLGCFPEVLDSNSAELYEGPLIMSEDSMIWAANLWNLLEHPSSKDFRAHREHQSVVPNPSR